MKLQLLEKRLEKPDIVTFLFTPDSELNFKPGQFLRYHIPDPKSDERSENRFFSIASAPFEGVVRLTTRFTTNESSTFKKDLQKLKLGDYVEVFGPSGSFIIEDPNKDYVFIAGGIGITPFRSILLNLDHEGQPLNITLLYANRTKEPLFKAEFEAIAARHREFKIYYIVSSELTTETRIAGNVKMLPGKINETILKSSILNLQSPIFYISGPEIMVQSFEDILKQMDVPKENIKRDYFPGYEHY